MDEIICYTANLAEGVQQDLTFMELLFNDKLAEGKIECPDYLFPEIGGINHKLGAKQNYEFLLRAIQKYPVRTIGVAEAFAPECVAATAGPWESFCTDAYIAGKYSQELLSSGYFNSVLETLLAEACGLPNQAEGAAWLEKMVSHAEEYYEIDDVTRPILIYRGSDVCYNTLNHFADALAAALRSHRQIVEIFQVEEGEEKALAKFIGCRYKAVIGIQTYVFSIKMEDGKTNLHDLIVGPKYNMILDHPGWMKRHIEDCPQCYYLLTHDRNYCVFARQYYKKIKDCLYLPPGGMLPEERTPSWEKQIKLPYQKQYDVIFIGSYRDYRERLKQLYTYKRPYRFLAAHLIQRMRRYPNEPAEQSMRKMLCDYGLNFKDADFLELFFELRQVCFCIMLYYREKTIWTLLDAGIEIHVYSDSWKNAPFAGHPCLRCHPALNMEESLCVLQQSKISLNIMSWHKDGLTERILNSMLCKSAVVSDRSTILEQEFENQKEIVLFDLEHIHTLPSVIKGLLADEENLQKIANHGYEKAAKRHLWKHRAQELLAHMESLNRMA